MEGGRFVFVVAGAGKSAVVVLRRTGLRFAEASANDEHARDYQPPKEAVRDAEARPGGVHSTGR